MQDVFDMLGYVLIKSDTPIDEIIVDGYIEKNLVSCNAFDFGMTIAGKGILERRSDDRNFKGFNSDELKSDIIKQMYALTIVTLRGVREFYSGDVVLGYGLSRSYPGSNFYLAASAFEPRVNQASYVAGQGL